MNPGEYNAKAHTKEAIVHQRPEIAIGDELPYVELVRLTKEGKPEVYVPSQIMTGKTVVIFTVPGPFTPTCSRLHLAGFAALREEFKKKNAELFCMALSTPDVMQGWFQVTPGADAVKALADFGGELTFKMGIGMDAAARGLGYVPKRGAFIFQEVTPHKYVLKHKSIEQDASLCGITSAESILKLL